MLKYAYQLGYARALYNGGITKEAFLPLLATGASWLGGKMLGSLGGKILGSKTLGGVGKMIGQGIGRGLGGALGPKGATPGATPGAQQAGFTGSLQ